MNEVIEQNSAATKAIEFANQNVDQVIGKSVSERCESGFQFVAIDVSRIVGIEGTKAILPVGDILPQSPEILEADGSAVFLVKHTCEMGQFQLNQIVHEILICTGIAYRS